MKEEIKFRFGRAGEVAAYSSRLKQIRINLKYIETIEHLYEVITHEILHKILDEQGFQIRREHKLIEKIQWADYNI